MRTVTWGLVVSEGELGRGSGKCGGHVSSSSVPQGCNPAAVVQSIRNAHVKVTAIQEESPSIACAKVASGVPGALAMHIVPLDDEPRNLYD